MPAPRAPRTLLLPLLFACGAPGRASDAAARDTAPADTAPAGEVRGNHVDDDGDGAVDELDPPDRLFPEELVSVGPERWLAADSSYAPLVYAPPTGTDWSLASPVGWRTDTLVCCASEQKVWLPDLDGDGLEELAVNGDDRTWFEGMYFSRTVVYPGSVVTGGAFTLADAGWESADTIEGVRIGRDGAARVLVEDSAGAALVPRSGFDDGVLDAAEATASIEGAWAWPTVTGAADLDGDGVDDLVTGAVARNGTDHQPELWTFGGADLDAIGLSAADAAAHVTLGDEAWSVASGVCADFDGDGAVDLALHTRRLDGQRWSAEVVVWRGPLVGTPTIHATVPVTADAGATPFDSVALGDLDGDGRADAGFGVRGDVSDVAIFLGATLAGGGTLDWVADRWAVRSGEQGSGLSFGAFAGDLDADGTIDLALASFDPIAPDGTLPASTYASEIYLDLGG